MLKLAPESEAVKRIDAALSEWLKLVPASGRLTLVQDHVVPLRDMTAEDYVDSDPLDLDHLTGGGT